MTMSSNVSEIVKRICANRKEEGGCATLLNDVWCNEMSAKARELITAAEHEQLEQASKSEDEYHEAVDEAVAEILEDFVRFLAGQYSIKLVERLG